MSHWVGSNSRGKSNEDLGSEETSVGACTPEMRGTEEELLERGAPWLTTFGEEAAAGRAVWQPGKGSELGSAIGAQFLLCLPVSLDLLQGECFRVFKKRQGRGSM